MPNDNTELHIYVVKASSVVIDNFIPLLEQFSKNQITALFSTVNHTFHPFNVIDNGKAEHPIHIQMENTGSSASCCEILKHWVRAPDNKGEINKHQEGKEKKFQMEKDRRGRRSKGHRTQCPVHTQDSGSLKSTLADNSNNLLGICHVPGVA